VALVVGCAGDPQGIDGQMERLRRAGARVTRSLAAAVGYAAAAISQAREAADGAGRAAPETAQPPTAAAVGAERPAAVATGDRGDTPPVPLTALAPPAVINVGPDHFAASVAAQGAAVAQVDWRPPAGGDERLASILERMKTR